MDEDFIEQGYQALKAKKMQFEPKAEVIALTHKPKFLYPQFNLFELQVNRFRDLPEFARLRTEFTALNRQLEDWKTHDKPIRNLFLTYHLYQNLFSRVKYTSSLVLDREEARRAYQQIERWFAVEKPKVRNPAPEPEQGQLRQVRTDRESSADIDRLLVTQSTKRQLKVYESMARTSHTEFFPPRQRLLQYKRRELAEGAERQRRSSSVTVVSKGMARYRGSFATTRTSFFKSTEPNAATGREEPAVAPFSVEEAGTVAQQEVPQPGVAEGEEVEREEAEREKQVQQQQMLQQNIVQVVHEEDQPEEGDGEEEQEPREQHRYRKYRADPDAQAQLKAEENIKDQRQSTLRRILRQKEEAVRRKMEELSLAQQAANWGALKARHASEEHRKLERMHLANRYNELEYHPRTLAQKQEARQREIPAFEGLVRSRSTSAVPLEQDIERLKIGRALKTYGKYIGHVPVEPLKVESAEEKEQARVMRSTSLTAFCRQGKRTPFSSLVDKLGPALHNDQAYEQMAKVKDRLAKTAVAVEKREILAGLGVFDVQKWEGSAGGVFPPQKTLFNNPFFPKHLYQTKPKKKKK